MMKGIILEKKRPSWTQLLPRASPSLAHTEEKGLRPDGRKNWVLDFTRRSSSPSHNFTAHRGFPGGVWLPRLPLFTGLALCY